MMQPKRRTAATTTRRTQEQRRREAKDKILRAAIELLVEKGFAGFSTIAVAARAGVSRGARENYFKTKYDLIDAAWEAALARAEARARRRAEQISVSADPVESFLESSRSFFLGKEYIALLELAMAARTDRRVAKIFQTLFKENRKRHDHVWIDALSRAGYPRRDVTRYIDLANCVFRGAALMSSWGLPASLYQPLLADLRALAPAARSSPARNLTPSSPRKRRPRAKQTGSPLARE
jgi:AcrR family transcriptional regulator